MTYCRMTEESGFWPKTFVWFFRPNHRQWQKDSTWWPHGVKPPSAGPDVQRPVHGGLWRELQSRTQAPWPAMLSCIAPFLAQVSLFGSHLIGKLEVTFPHSGARSVTLQEPFVGTGRSQCFPWFSLLLMLLQQVIKAFTVPSIWLVTLFQYVKLATSIPDSSALSPAQLSPWQWIVWNS